MSTFPLPPCGDENCTAVDRQELLAQIGPWNLLAISGGRVEVIPGGVRLPVANGYAVEVMLDCARDFYEVRRTFTRGGTRTVKGTETHVYCFEVGDVAYRASCFRNVPFGCEAAA